MKDTMFDVLMYIFENYMDEDSGDDPDEIALHTELGEAGFHQGEINKAFAWLEDLSSLCDQQEATPGTINCSAGSVRLYAEPELKKISRESRGFLASLEYYQIISPSLREVILDRAMALETDRIDLDQMKWVTMMVLYNQPERDSNYLWLENLLLDLEEEVRH